METPLMNLSINTQDSSESYSPTSLKFGDAVYVIGFSPRLTGVVMYVSESLDFDNENTIGILLTGGSVGKGNSDGTWKDVRHFTSEQNDSIFVKEGQVEKRRLTKLEALRLRRESLKQRKKRDTAFGVEKAINGHRNGLRSFSYSSLDEGEKESQQFKDKRWKRIIERRSKLERGSSDGKIDYRLCEEEKVAMDSQQSNTPEKIDKISKTRGNYGGHNDQKKFLTDLENRLKQIKMRKTVPNVKAGQREIQIKMRETDPRCKAGQSEITKGMALPSRPITKASFNRNMNKLEELRLLRKNKVAERHNVRLEDSMITPKRSNRSFHLNNSKEVNDKRKGRNRAADKHSMRKQVKLYQQDLSIIPPSTLDSTISNYTKTKSNSLEYGSIEKYFTFACVGSSVL